MHRLYLIVPVILLVLFGGVYWQHSRVAEREAAAQASALAATQETEAAQRADAERVARAEAEQRAAARRAEEEKQDAEKRARYEEESRRIAADTARFAARVTELSTEAAALEKQLGDLRARRAQLNTDNFALAREVELARIAKRNAELEIQRLTEMVARQAANTTLAR